MLFGPQFGEDRKCQMRPRFIRNAFSRAEFGCDNVRQPRFSHQLAIQPLRRDSGQLLMPRGWFAGNGNERHPLEIVAHASYHGAMVAKMDVQQALLKHFLAAIAYRTQKALRGAPATGYRKKPFLVSRFSLGTIAPNEKRETAFPSAEQLLQGPLA